MKVAIYARVSTLNHGQDAGMQTREMHQFSEARGWTLADEYVDSGISGAKDSRPELNRLIADAHKRKFEVVVVWKFDRFARSVSHLLRALETFQALGIEFVSLSEQLDTSTPTGKMVFTVLGAVAELERSLIAERVRAGLRNAKCGDDSGWQWFVPRARIARADALHRFSLSNDISKLTSLGPTKLLRPTLPIRFAQVPGTAMSWMLRIQSSARTGFAGALLALN